MASGSPAGNSLALITQVSDESDEARRKKLLEMQQQRLLPNSSAAGRSLLGIFNSGYSAALGGGY
jgi:hypothetical protein